MIQVETREDFVVDQTDTFAEILLERIKESPDFRRWCIDLARKNGKPTEWLEEIELEVTLKAVGM